MLCCLLPLCACVWYGYCCGDVKSLSFGVRTKPPSTTRGQNLPRSMGHEYTFYQYKIRQLLWTKAQRFRIYKRFKTTESLLNIKLCASECRSAIQNFNVDRENRIIKSEHVGKFFNYTPIASSLVRLLLDHSGLQSTDGSLTSDPVLKTELLQSVFSSAFTINNDTLPL